jgi:hypothetical protein
MTGELGHRGTKREGAVRAASSSGGGGSEEAILLLLDPDFSLQDCEAPVDVLLTTASWADTHAPQDLSLTCSLIDVVG